MSHYLKIKISKGPVPCFFKSVLSVVKVIVSECLWSLRVRVTRLTAECESKTLCLSQGLEGVGVISEIYVCTGHELCVTSYRCNELIDYEDVVIRDGVTTNGTQHVEVRWISRWM